MSVNILNSVGESVTQWVKALHSRNVNQGKKKRVSYITVFLILNRHFGLKRNRSLRLHQQVAVNSLGELESCALAESRESSRARVNMC